MPSGNPGMPKSVQHNAKNAAAHLGKRFKMSEQSRANVAKGNIGKWKGKKRVHSAEWRANQSRKMLGNRNWQSSAHNPTKIELALQDILSIYEIEPYKQFGRFQVDVYVPKLHIAFEADGYHWHSSHEAVEKDRLRDAYLMEEFSLPVIRVTEKELITWP